MRDCKRDTDAQKSLCQSGGAPALRPGAIAQSPGRDARLLPQSPKDSSVRLCLFCSLAYRVIITIFLQKLEFEPASKSFSYQLESLKSKYVLLNPRTEGAGCHRSGDEPPARRQGTDAEGGAKGAQLCADRQRDETLTGSGNRNNSVVSCEGRAWGQ